MRYEFLLILIFLCACGSSTVSNRELIGAMYEESKSTYFSDVPDFSALEAKKHQAAGALIVDVRPEAEREVSVIPGSISLDELGKRSPDTRQILILYCTIGHRSGMECQRLNNLGFNTFNLAGGILAWIDAGLVVHKSGTETSRVHVYGSRWDILPPDYQAVY